LCTYGNIVLVKVETLALSHRPEVYGIQSI
jgi:hypothetical protein